MIAKGLNQVTIDSTFSSTEANTETLSGASRYKLPIMRVNVPSGQDVKKITMPAGVNLKKVIVNVDGNVTGLNNETGEYLIKNDTTLTPTLSGSGTISARKIQDFKSRSLRVHSYGKKFMRMRLFLIKSLWKSRY